MSSTEPTEGGSLIQRLDFKYVVYGAMEKDVTINSPTTVRGFAHLDRHAYTR